MTHPIFNADAQYFAWWLYRPYIVVVVKSLFKSKRPLSIIIISTHSKMETIKEFCTKILHIIK